MTQTQEQIRLDAIEEVIAEIDRINEQKREDAARARRELFAQEGRRDENHD